MKYQHRKLAIAGWKNLSFVEQIANIGSEVERMILWRGKEKTKKKKKFLRTI